MGKGRKLKKEIVDPEQLYITWLASRDIPTLSFYENLEKIYDHQITKVLESDNFKISDEDLKDLKAEVLCFIIEKRNIFNIKENPIKDIFPYFHICIKGYIVNRAYKIHKEANRH